MFFTNISEAKSNLSRLVNKVCNEEDVIITKAGKPVARLIPYKKDTRPRKGAQWKGKIKISSDFNELPDDISKMFSGKSK